MTSLALSVDALLASGRSVGPVIGIDTGGPIAHLGLVVEGRILSSISQELSSHCAGLPGTVEELLSAAHLKMSDLAGIAIAIGPGSFTGLRVGLSYAKG